MPNTTSPFNALFCLLLGLLGSSASAQVNPPAGETLSDLRIEFLLNSVQLGVEQTNQTTHSLGFDISMLVEGPESSGGGVRLGFTPQESWEAPWDSAVGGVMEYERQLLDFSVFFRYIPYQKGFFQGNVIPYLEFECGLSSMFFIESIHHDGSDEAESQTEETDLAFMAGLSAGVRLLESDESNLSLALRFGSRIGGPLDQPSLDPDLEDGPPLNGGRQMVSFGVSYWL